MNLLGRMSINGIAQMGEKHEKSAANKENGKIAWRGLLPNINVPAREEITKNVVHFPMNSKQKNWQQAVSEAVIKRSINITEKGLP